MARTAPGPRARRGGTRIGLAALVTLLSTTGCGRADEPGPSGASASPVRPSVSAQDGRDTGACADGDCEVLVTEPVTVRFRGPSGAEATLHVTKVGPNEVAYTVKSGSGQSKAGTRGSGAGCVTVLRSSGSSNFCGGFGVDGRPNPQPDAVVIQAAPGEDGTALFHIVSD
ncbi:hypothetical protein ACIGO6_19940 [Streptomyces sp. NPDC053750]|uniref:hypothetical protein n=1 Tax=Streptomyces sp. NPDC053750 TaxID=3365714 RepID=UPI0037D4BB0D